VSNARGRRNFLILINLALEEDVVIIRLRSRRAVGHSRTSWMNVSARADPGDDLPARDVNLKKM